MGLKAPLGFLMGAALAHATGGLRQASAQRRSVSVPEATATELLVLPPVKSPALATGALAVGTLAVGSLAVAALAVGALAIGALAIGRLEMRQGRIRKLQIDDLTVGRLRVVETANAGVPDSDDAA